MTALRFIPLGGLGEIGMNCMAVEHDGKLVVIDCGVLFDDRGLGVEVIHVDWEWLLDRREDVVALVLTHGHEDHIGAVSYFLRDFDVPVYGPAYPIALAKHRIAEHPWHRGARIDFRVYDETSRMELAGMVLHPFPVTHSMPSCFGLVLETGAGLVVYTGDFKIDEDPPPGDRFGWDVLSPFRDRGVDLMLSDSTNAMTPGVSGGELPVGEALEELVLAHEGRVLVGLFASNLHRLRMLFDVARHTGRSVVTLGRSIETHVRIARELGLIPDPGDVLVPRERVSALSPEKTLVLATGSQGEPRAALARVAEGTHPDLTLTENELVILSSRVIPGNERPILDMIERLSRRGARVISRHDDPRVHVSGHAHRDEQRRLIEWLRPRAFLPIHGTFLHLDAHAALAREAGVPEVHRMLDGDVVEFSEGRLRTRERVWVGRVHVDRGGEPVDGRVLQERRTLAELGEAIVSLVVDEAGNLVGEAKLTTRGLVVEGDDRDLLEDACDAVERATANLRTPRLSPDDAEIEDNARRALRRFFHRELGKRPLVSALVHRVRR